MSSKPCSVCHKIKLNYISIPKTFSDINSISHKHKHQKSIYLSSLHIPNSTKICNFSVLLNKIHKQANENNEFSFCLDCGGLCILFAICSLHDVSWNSKI